MVDVLVIYCSINKPPKINSFKKSHFAQKSSAWAKFDGEILFLLYEDQGSWCLSTGCLGSLIACDWV